MQDVLTCPSCGLAAGRIHSCYNQKLADLAWAEINVCLHLQVRKCSCSNRVRRQRVFMKRPPLVAAPWVCRTATRSGSCASTDGLSLDFAR